MRRFILFISLAVAAGCHNVQPIGPLAGKLGARKSKSPKSKEAPPPVTVPAAKPTPPMNLIYPDEVTAENTQASIQKLRNELESDQKNIPAPPKTAEVSRYKSGVKQY